MEHKPSSAWDYTVAFFIAFLLFVFFGGYLYVRRGFLFDAPLSADPLYVPNKVVANAGLSMLALVFLIGPVSRYFDKFDKWIGYRKEIGIVAGFLLIAHGAISYAFLPKKFPAENFFEPYNMNTTLAGLAGILLLVFLTVISLKILIEKIGGARWWFLQRWGLRLVIVFSALHVIVMKWEGWEKWFLSGVPQTAELALPWMTPASLISALFLIWVILLRVYESCFLYKDFGFATKEISIDPVLRLRGRQFFLVSFWMLMFSYVVILSRWIAM